MEVLTQKNVHFKFPPLDPAQRFVRLLRIQPDGLEGVLNCTLRTANLSDKPVFTALSYTWDLDQSVETRLITINHRPFHIFANLYRFLCQSKTRSCDHDLWADAISINQADIQEKNRQVALMGQIFAAAENVFAWLGPEADDSSDLIDHLNVLASLFGPKSWERSEAEPEHQNTPIPYYSPSNNAWEYRLSRMPNKSKSPVPLEFWRRYLVLLKRPYFGRIWIVQELLLARNEVTFFCGDRVCFWTTLCIPAESVKEARREDDLRDLESTGFQKFRAVKDEKRGQNLQELVEAFGDLGCTDVWDRVFALLGLLRGPNRRVDIQPDYSITPLELFCRMVAAFPLAHGLVSRSATYLDLLRLEPNAERSDIEHLMGRTAGDATKSYWGLKIPFEFCCRWTAESSLLLMGQYPGPPMFGFLFIAPHLSWGDYRAYIFLRYPDQTNDTYHTYDESIEYLDSLGLGLESFESTYHGSVMKRLRSHSARFLSENQARVILGHSLQHEGTSVMALASELGPHLYRDKDCGFACNFGVNLFLDVLACFKDLPTCPKDVEFDGPALHTDAIERRLPGC